MARVMDDKAMCGMGVVEGATWKASDVVGATWEAAEVGEADNGGAVQGQAVGPSRVAVRPPASILGTV
jgi:hypothetical protein